MSDKLFHNTMDHLAKDVPEEHYEDKIKRMIEESCTKEELIVQLLQRLEKRFTVIPADILETIYRIRDS